MNITDYILEDDDLFQEVIVIVSDSFEKFDNELQVKIVYKVYRWLENNNNYRIMNSESRKNYRRKLERRNTVEKDLCELSLIDDLKNKPNKTLLFKELSELTSYRKAEIFMGVLKLS